MKRFILTSPSFEGEMRLVYGPDWRLLGIDLTGCSLTVVQAEYFLRKVPAHYTKTGWNAAFGRAQITVAVQEVKVEFEQFWEAYGLKHHRQRCEKLWARLAETDRARAMHGLDAYARHLGRNTWKTKADPDTYLRGRYWENEWE